MAANKIFDSTNSQKRWVDEMKSSVQVQVGLNMPYSVYRVPEGFIKTIPEAYAPRKIGLGPYHHLRPELHKMQKKKLASLGEAETVDKLVYVDKVVSYLKQIEPMVRAFYDQYLDLDSDTLAWIVGVDGLFLLGYLKCALQNTVGNDDDWRNTDILIEDIFMLENQIPYSLLTTIGVVYRSCLVKDDNDELHTAYVDCLVNGAFLALCQRYSPLQLSTDWAHVKELTPKHLLHRMYQLIVDNTETEISSKEGPLCDGAPRSFDFMEDYPVTGYINMPCTVQDIEQNTDNVDIMLGQVFPQAAHSAIPVRKSDVKRERSLAHLLTHMHHIVDKKRSQETKSGSSAWNNVKQKLLNRSPFATKRDNAPSSFNVSKDKMNRTWTQEREISFETTTMENLKKIPPLLKGLRVPGAGTAGSFLSLIGQVPWDKVMNMQGPEGLRLKFEQIKIPSASDMSKVLNIKFQMVAGGLQGVMFNKKERRLYLPKITLTTYSEIIIRNLLAFEAATTDPDSLLQLAQYIDMMCGMINTKDDIDIMEKAEIVRVGNLSTKQILGIFNGVRKTTGKSEAELEAEAASNLERDRAAESKISRDGESNIGKAIDEINKMYDDVLRVKARRKMRECATGGMKFANIIIGIIVMVLLLLQTFCPGLDCTSWFGRSSVNRRYYRDH